MRKRGNSSENPELRIFKSIERVNNQVFFSKISKQENGCWDWIGPISKSGYGTYTGYLAHRVSYTLHKEEIPKGLVIDHICRNKKCVNPDHLRAVTHRVNCLENSQREDIRKRGFCGKNHVLDDGNTYIDKRSGSKVCRQCRTDSRGYRIVEIKLNKEIAKNKLLTGMIREAIPVFEQFDCLSDNEHNRIMNWLNKAKEIIGGGSDGN